MKKLLSLIAVMAMLLGLATVAAAGGSNDPATWDTSIFVEPASIFEAGYDGIECMDIDLGLYHLIPARNGGSGDYFHWTGTMEKMPANVEENECCFTSATSASETVIFWDGVPNFSKDLFKWWEGTTKDVYIPDSVTEIDEDAFVMNSTITLHFSKRNAVALAYAQNRGMAYQIMKDPVVLDTRFDTTVFEIPDDDQFAFHGDAQEIYMTCLCVCSDYLGIYHYEKGDGETGEAYFKWMNKWETMPDAIDGTCFYGVPNDPYLKTVVFWNGVPNLVNDLFKDWEAITDDVYIPDSVTEIAENCFVEGSHITLHFTANNEVALAYAEAHGMNYEIVPEPDPDASQPDVSDPDISDPDVSDPDTSEPTTDQGTPDASIFFEEPEISVNCMDGAYLGLDHLADFQRGFTFFKWVGNMEIMPPNEDGSCLSIVPARTQAAWCAKVVFLDGVPNLSKDLFKWWEGTTKDIYIPDSVTEIDEECFVEGSNITLHFTEQNEVALAYAKSHGMRYEIMGKGYGGKVLLNASVFEVPMDIIDSYEPSECTEPLVLGMRHLEKDGVAFYLWSDRFEKMPPNTEGSCFMFPSIGSAYDTVVFFDGVPNLSKDLFRYWEGAVHDVYIPDSVTEIDEDCFVMNSTITIHFTQNNAVALAYAKSHDMAFEVMDGERMPGDVDFDKSVDMKDTLALRKTIAGLPAAYEIYSTDVNTDDSTDMKDVLALRKSIANLDK